MTARRFHALTAAVAIVAVVLQLVLVIRGGQVLDEVRPPALGLRLARFVAYFTVQSNVLVALASVTLALDPARDTRVWRVLRLAGVVGITVTGLVHFLLLRPLSTSTGPTGPLTSSSTWWCRSWRSPAGSPSDHDPASPCARWAGHWRGPSPGSA